MKRGFCSPGLLLGGEWKKRREIDKKRESLQESGNRESCRDWFFFWGPGVKERVRAERTLCNSERDGPKEREKKGWDRTVRRR